MEMTENKRLTIACAAPTLLLLGSLGASTLPSQASNESASATEVVETFQKIEEEVQADGDGQVGDEKSSPSEDPQDVVETIALKPTVPDGSSEAESTSEASSEETVIPDEALVSQTDPVESTSHDLDDVLEGIDSDDVTELETSDVAVENIVADEVDTSVVEASNAFASVDATSTETSSDPEEAAAPPSSELVEKASEVKSEAIDEFVDATVEEATDPASTFVDVAEASPPESVELPVVSAVVDDTETPDIEETSPPAVAFVETDSPSTVDDVSETVDPAPAFPPAATSIGQTAPQLEPAPIIAPKTATENAPFLGVGIREQTNTRVTSLYANSTATKLGIKIGDELASVNGTNIKNLSTLRDALQDIGPGSMTTVMVMRNGEKLKLGPLPLGKR